MTTQPSPADPVTVQGGSRWAFGATTAALVALAAGGTAVLVAQATDDAATPTSLPRGVLPAEGIGGGSLVLDPPTATPADPTERALREALARRREPGRRTLTAPLVPVSAPAPTPTPARRPPVTPPAVTPPVAEPPVVTPPEPVDPPTARPALRGHTVKPEKGKGRALGHGKHGRDRDQDQGKGADKGKDKGKGRGRHGR